MLKMQPATWLAFTVLPALAIGGGLWLLADALPGCTNSVTATTPSPSGALDLVVFSRECDATTPLNTQAALIVSGQTLPEDAEGFVALAGQHDLAPVWSSDTALALTLPHGSQIYRQEESVETVTIEYRSSSATDAPG